MDNDSGWAAKEITLTANEDDGHRARLTLPCRWIELVQAWDGQAGSYFLVSGVQADHLTDTPWEFVGFKDNAGKAHRYRIGAATPVDAQAIRLMRAR
jgi:hypothetical protein